jgi:hypothetical protein
VDIGGGGRARLFSEELAIPDLNLIKQVKQAMARRGLRGSTVRD